MELANINILALIERDTQLKKAAGTHGGEWKGACPVCGGSDRFSVNPNKQPKGVWRCRQCGVGGDAIAYLSHVHGMDFKSAAQFLGLPNEWQPSQVRTTSPLSLRRANLEKPLLTDMDLQRQALELIQNSQVALWESSEARAYLKRRGISEKMMRTYRLGYIPPSPKPRFLNGQPLNHAILIPWWMGEKVAAIRFRFLKFEAGQVVNGTQDIYGKAQKIYQLRGGMMDTLWGIPQNSKTALLLEGELDQVCFASHSSQKIDIFSLGGATQNHTQEAVQQLAGYERVILGLDGDEAGQKAAQWWANQLAGKTWGIRYPEGVKDITEVWQLGYDLDEWLENSLYLLQPNPIEIILQTVWRPQNAILTQVSSRYLNQAGIQIQSPLVAIKSPIGTGKTEWIGDCLALSEESALLPGHRRTLLKNQANRLNERDLGIDEYNEHNLSHFAPHRLVITPNSLHKLTQEDGTLPAYKHLIIDEFEQFLAHLVGETFNGGAGVQALQILKNLAQTAEQIIVADADLSDLGLNWLNYLRPETPQVVINDYQVARKPLTLHAEQTAPQADLEARLERGEKGLLVATDSLEFANSLHATLAGLGYDGQIFTRETSSKADVKPLIDNINQTVSEADYVIFTSTLGTGVDIQAPCPAIYGFFFNYLANSPSEQLQMLGRARQAEEAIVFSRGIERDLETDSAAIKARYLGNYQSLVRLLGKHGIYTFQDGRAKVTPEQEDYLDLFAQVQAARNAQMLNPRQTFAELAQNQYEIHLAEDTEPDQELLDLLWGMKASLDETQKEAVLNAEPISEFDYKAAQESYTLTDDIRFGYVRGRIEDFYKVPVTEYHYENFRAGEPSQIRNLMNFFRPLADLAHIDAGELAEGYAIQNRSNTSLLINILSQVLAPIFPQGLHFERIWADQAWEGQLAQFAAIWEALEADQVLGRDRRASRSPVAMLRAALKKLGLRLIKDKTTLQNEKVYFYQLDFAEGQRLASDALIREKWFIQNQLRTEATAQTVAQVFALEWSEIPKIPHILKENGEKSENLRSSSEPATKVKSATERIKFSPPEAPEAPPRLESEAEFYIRQSQDTSGQVFLTVRDTQGRWGGFNQANSGNLAAQIANLPSSATLVWLSKREIPIPYGGKLIQLGGE